MTRHIFGIDRSQAIPVDKIGGPSHPRNLRATNPRYQVIAPRLMPWWQSFNMKWSCCNLCPLHEHRERVVHFRGVIPAPICFVGEGPGEVEDQLGRTFCGPAGKTLDRLLDLAGLEDGDYCIINVVACVPLDTETGKTRPPEKSEAKACKQRFLDLFFHIDPKLVVLMGSTAQKFVDPACLKGRQYVETLHPSAILRNGEKTSDMKRFYLSVQQAAAPFIVR